VVSSPSSLEGFKIINQNGNNEPQPKIQYIIRW